MTAKRLYHSIRLLLIRKENKRADYLRRKNVFHKVGDNCRWGSWILPLYPELISLHNNVCVHKTATILTHDMINSFLKKANPDTDFGSSEVLGPVEIEDNVYVSMNAIIMPGVKIGRNSIICAGAIVTNDIPNNSIVSGNPAKIIGNFDKYVALRKLSAKTNPVFINQHLSSDVAEKTWQKFNNKHSSK